MYIHTYIHSGLLYCIDVMLALFQFIFEQNMSFWHRMSIISFLITLVKWLMFFLGPRSFVNLTFSQLAFLSTCHFVRATTLNMTTLCITVKGYDLAVHLSVVTSSVTAPAFFRLLKPQTYFRWDERRYTTSDKWHSAKRRVDKKRLRCFPHCCSHKNWSIIIHGKTLVLQSKQCLLIEMKIYWCDIYILTTNLLITLINLMLHICFI